MPNTKKTPRTSVRQRSFGRVDSPELREHIERNRRLYEELTSEGKCRRCGYVGRVNLFGPKNFQPLNLDSLLRAPTWKLKACASGSVVARLCDGCSHPQVREGLRTQAHGVIAARLQARAEAEMGDPLMAKLKAEADRLEKAAQAARGYRQKGLYHERAAVWRKLEERREEIRVLSLEEHPLPTVPSRSVRSKRKLWKPDSKWHWTRAKNEALREAGIIPGLKRTPEQWMRLLEVYERNEDAAVSPEQKAAWARLRTLARRKAESNMTSGLEEIE